MSSESAAHAGEAPYVQATGAPEGLPPLPIGSPDRERSEREAAFRRGRERGRRHTTDRVAPRHAGGDGRDGDTLPRDHGDAVDEVVSRAFTTLADNVRDFAVFLMNREGIITYWGESARLIKGWSRDQAEGAHLRLLYPEGGSEDGTAEAHLHEAARRGEYVGEGQRVRSDGSKFWGGISLTALRDGSNELIGFAKVTRDLTGRRAAEAALKGSHDEAEAAVRRAEEASRAKGLFLATMSHEIRTPINAAMGYIDLLEMELAGPLSSRQQQYLERIRFNNTHLLGIIDEILDFSRLDAGRLTPCRSAGLLEEPVRDALRMVELQARARNIAISDSVSDFLVDIPYWGDENRVRQILVVLLSNAVKFTPANGRITVSAGTAAKPPADVRLRGRGPWVYVRVEDTGPGIPPDRLAAIFQPFEQADMTHTRPHGGAGLGLAIAQRLAQAMDGDLAVRSQPQMGSSFFLWLPAAAEEAVKSPRSRTERMARHSVTERDGVVDAVDALITSAERISLHAFRRSTD
jgi:PAS domain S-box-containing protein